MRYLKDEVTEMYASFFIDDTDASKSFAACIKRNGRVLEKR